MKRPVLHRYFRQRAGLTLAASLLLAASVVTSFSTPSHAAGAQSVTFTTHCCIISSADGLTFTVPTGITSLHVQVTGAGGGGSFWGESQSGLESNPGGNGATVSATLSVTPGEVLSLQLGTAGQNSVMPQSGQMQSGNGGNGFATGGAGGVNSTSALGAGGGGGATAILSGATPLVVAGGGGGASGAVPLTIGSPTNYFGGNCPNSTSGTSGFEYCATPTTTPESLQTTMSGCRGLDAVGPNANPTSTCPVAVGTDNTHDGHDGSDATSTNASAFPPGGGGGGGWIGGAGGIASHVPLLAGGGHGGSSYTNAERAAVVSVTSATNAVAIDVAQFCSVGGPIDTARYRATVPPTTVCSTHPIQAGDGTITITYGGDDTTVFNATESSTLLQSVATDPHRTSVQPIASVAALATERSTTARAANPVKATPTYTG